MKFKSLGIAVGMAVGLFFYGYFLSTAGHDHSAHQNGGHQEDAVVSSHDDEHGDHDHGDSHH